MILLLSGCMVWLFACTVDEVIGTEESLPPTVIFDEESGTYAVKINREITVTASVDNAESPAFTWKHEGKIVGTDLSYTFSSGETGRYYHTFRVDADNGSVEEEIYIDVVELTPPVISLAVPEEGYLTAVIDTDLEIVPQVKYGEEAEYEWRLDGTMVGTGSGYVFRGTELKQHTFTLKVVNEDGSDELPFTVIVVDPPTLTLSFDNGKFTVPFGRSIGISPYVAYASEQPQFEWRVDGILQPGETGDMFMFTPNDRGNYRITVTGTDGDVVSTAEVEVESVAPEGSYYRPAGASSSAFSTVVFEFLPAPGQFINESYTVTTMEEACAKAQRLLDTTSYISLGGFGGYIVVGFDHSIDNSEGAYDFAIYGNSFTNSSEPGIVYVMQDENGNGLPDDTWYELRGSETGKAGTLRNYAVTYYKPAAPGMDVQWVDNYGNKGIVSYLASFHSQPYYYPNWVTTASYTLRGTRLEARNYLDESNGQWVNPAYDWGYADNSGSDVGDSENSTGNVNLNYFKIENAMHLNGEPANLQYIDFIKVHTGVNASSGGLGEISTEVFKFEDVHLK